MLNLASFLLITGCMLGVVWWTCVKDTNDDA